MGKRKPRICIDLDGVIHRYSKGYQDGSFYDPPTPGAKKAIDWLKEHYEIAIFTARMVPDDDRFAPVTSKEDVEKYLRDNDIYFDEVTGHKLPAVAYVDDRAIEFKGDWEYVLLRVLTLENKLKEEFGVEDFDEIWGKFGKDD